jgi:hypothetical protein
MTTIWSEVWAEVKKAARQAPRLYAAPFVGAARQTRIVLRQIERENRHTATGRRHGEDRRF